MQKDEEIVFRTPEIPKLRRRKSLPNTSSASKEDRKSQISLTSSSSFSESLNSSETSFGDLSLNSSYEDYAEIETLTNSFDKLTNQFDDDKSAKRKKKESRFNESLVQNLELSKRVNTILKKPNQDAKTVLTIFQQLLDDDIDDQK